MPEPTAAGQIWPHLRQGTPSEVEQRRTSSVAAALFPSLSRSAKAEHQRWDEWRKRYRDNLLQGLRELNGKVDERLRREGRR
jgi:hypothetical protein